jgi:hypothetical protein
MSSEVLIADFGMQNVAPPPPPSPLEGEGEGGGESEIRNPNSAI